MELQLSAKESPRFEDDKICWYEGDTFSIVWELNLIDEEGTAVDLSPLDEIVFQFLNRNKELVHEFACVVGNEQEIVLDFTDKISAKFTPGTYQYIIKYKGTNTTTIATNGRVEVE